MLEENWSSGIYSFHETLQIFFCVGCNDFFFRFTKLNVSKIIVYQLINISDDCWSFCFLASGYIQSVQVSLCAVRQRASTMD